MKNWTMRWILVGALACQAHGGTIQDAVNAAPTGGVVYVAAGHYAETVTLRPDVLLVGAGIGQTVIEPGSTVPAIVGARNAGVMNISIRGASNGVLNAGYFVGLLGCEIMNCGASGVAVSGGSALLIGNHIDGNVTGVNCLNSDPLLAGNIISRNTTGVHAQHNAAPTLAQNLFVSNSVAVLIDDDSTAALSDNVFDGNGTDTQGHWDGANNEDRTLADAELAAHAGEFTPDAFRALMKTMHDRILAQHGTVIYELGDPLGVFRTTILNTRSRFRVSACTTDTKISTYDAFDAMTLEGLPAQPVVVPAQLPYVDVAGTVPDQQPERYVLDMVYAHGPSYQALADGTRVFHRLTNLSNVEVVLPAGYHATAVQPEGATIETREGRELVRLGEIGPKSLTVALTPAR